MVIPVKNDDLVKFHSYSSQNVRKTSHFSFCLPTSFLAFVLLVLLAYNSFSIFFFSPVFPTKKAKETEKKLSSTKISTSEPTFAMKKETTPLVSTIHLASLHNSTHFSSATGRKPKRVSSTPILKAQSSQFSKRVNRFFYENSCKVKVFMTWISSLEKFGKREMFCIESLYKFHPNACLLIVSDSMDSNKGAEIFTPFLRMNFKIMAVSTDFRYVFKNTEALGWYDQLKKGKIQPGEISLGQNLSNLLRLVLLYKYGGIYMDLDFIVLKRLDKLKNSIGAQTVDLQTHKWSRLNNALMIFDKKHPLLSKFIEEFALTFDGNRWGHNGPYLVSRVVEKVHASMGGVRNFTILPPTAFYVVDWAAIGSLFQKPRDKFHVKWVNAKLKQIYNESYAVHLWNRQSKGIKVEDGSIISHLITRSCVFCNSSSL